MTTTNNVEPPRRHIAVCAFPFGTHAAPLLLLARRLSTATPDTRYTFFNVERSNTALFKAIDVSVGSNIVPYNITLSNEAPAAGPGNPMKAIEEFLEHSPGGFRRAMEEVEAHVGVKISIIISDAFLWYCSDIAEEKGLDWIALWTAGTASLSAHLYTDAIRALASDNQGEEGKEDVLVSIPGLSNVRISDLPMGLVSGDLDAPFSQMLHKMGTMLPKAKVVTLNVFQELSPLVVNDLNSKLKLLCVGPFPLTCPPQVYSDPDNCLDWLDQHGPKTIAYISFGTVATPPPHEIRALAKALEGSDIPFVWSMSDSVRANLPESFIEKIQNEPKVGKIVSWAPQIKLLGHPSTGVFVTHCGWNSIMESISTGVPLICRPIIGDQELNQRIVEIELKFGIGIEGGCFTQSGTTNALNQVLASEKGEEMRKNVEELKKLAEESVKQGGSSNENFNALIELITSS
uniref:Glycosyltransferase n=1 Tax=Dianthus caryophyllus TaxID=3570 RepID=Q60FF0_DIACA|nr:UDP-glucose:flavonol 3-O-glucosyltransferase [Dianthus caryophyllus]BAF75881.1 glucosyltransferase [Dianthus caryophyllus]